MTAIPSALVKTLRDMTGAGIMDAKRALVETAGDLEKARELLRRQGIADASSRTGRVAREGLVDAYIHPGGRVGVLLEVNCETDFVARTDQFRALVHDVALQIAAHSPEVVRRSEVPAETVERERRIARGQAQDQGKSEAVAEKMLAGKLEAFFARVCLYDQSWARDEGSRKRRVEEVIREVASTLKEQVDVARFTRYTLGEGAAEPAGAGPAPAGPEPVATPDPSPVGPGG